MLTPTDTERTRRNEVVVAILGCVERNETIFLPHFEAASGEMPASFALHMIGSEPNSFGGTVGGYRYQFEGEEDLLHLFITKLDGGELSPEEGQSVAGFVLNGVPPGLMWFKPGKHSQHFFVGHDVLPDCLKVEL